MITLHDVSVEYENLTALNRVSVQFPSGKISGLIGPNGAGKSSLLKSCMGLIPEFSGTIHFGEHDLQKDRHWIKEHCGYAPEDTILPSYLQGRELLQLIATLRQTVQPDEEINRLCQLLHFEGKENELIVNYSHGMRKKVSVGVALVGKPDYLIIDEALNGLDSLALFNLKHDLQNQAGEGKTIIISSHILPLIEEWCDPIMIMNKGTIIQTFTKAELHDKQSQTKQTFEEIFIEMINNS